MPRSLSLTLTITAVLTIMGVSGYLLWQNNDPRLAEVELIADLNQIEAATPSVVTEAAVVPTTETTTAAAVETTNPPVVSEIADVQTVTVSAVETAEPIALADSTTQTTTEVIEAEVSTVLVSVLGPSIKVSCAVPVTETTVVQKVMLAASEQCGFSYAGKKQGGLGFFVEEIAGLKQSVKDGFYWVFSVNGEKSQLGVSTRTVEPDDLIQWNYEAEY